MATAAQEDADIAQTIAKLKKKSKGRTPDDTVLSDYLSKLVLSEGEHKGAFLEVMPWQKKFCKAILKHRIVALSMARGNAKTTTAAGIAAAALDPNGPLFVERGTIILVASATEQARVAFNHLLFFLRPILGANLDDGRSSRQGEWRILNSTHNREIEHRPTGTRLRVIGSDPKRAHGLAPSLVIADEPAKWQGKNRGEEMFIAIETAMMKHPEAKLLCIGTRPDDPRHWFSKLLATRSKTVMGMDYNAKRYKKIYSVAAMKAANPSWDYMPTLRQYLKDFAAKAKVSKQIEVVWKALHLNLGTPEVMDRETLVPAKAWLAAHVKQLPARDGPVFVGIDLGGGTSMSAVAFYWANSGRLEAYACIPNKPSVEERDKEDGMRGYYLEMVKRGELWVHEGFSPDNQKLLFDAFQKIQGEDVEAIYADRYKDTETKDALAKLGYLDLVEFAPVGSGKDGSEFVTGFRYEVTSGRLKTVKNLLIDVAMANSVIRYDGGNDNPALDKRGQKGRIDVMQASIIAVGLARRWRLPQENEVILFGAALAEENARAAEAAAETETQSESESPAIDVSKFLVKFN